MLGCTVHGYIKPCSPVTGGVGTLLVGDASDFDLTSGADDANGDHTGYSTIARHSGATATNSIGTVTVTNGGSGYTTAPTVAFSGGGGTGAAGTATISGGLVTGVTITNAGTGYTTTPTVAFSGGGGTGAAATAFRSTNGANLFRIDAIVDTLGVDITQANADGSSSSYEYVITGNLAQMSQVLTNFNMKIDGAAVCCQLIFFWRNTDGKVFVIGESNVDSTIIPPFRVRNDGSTFHTGKKFADFNGENMSLKGSYSRPPYEFTGGWTAILAMAI